MSYLRRVSTAALALFLALTPATAWAGPDQDKDWIVTRQHVDAPIPIWHDDTNSFSLNTINLPMEKTALWIPKAWTGTSEKDEAKSQLVIPAKRPDLAFLGSEGAVLNAAPQNPGPGNTPIWAGLGAGEVGDADKFEGETYTLDLISVDGPGRMEMFIDNGDSVNRFLSSHDTAYRSVYNPRHSHMYTTFTQPGRYVANYKMTARSADGTAIYSSPITPLVWQVVSYTIDDVDVFTIIDDDNNRNAYINYIHVRKGTINQSFTFEYKRKLDERDEELLITAIPDIRERFKSHAKEIIVPFEMGWKMKEATFVIPQRGDKKHLLELSEMNGKQYKFDRLKQAEKLNPEQKQTRLMKELQEKLRLPKLPYQIECFDNSNISGTDAVAGCIVYKGMKPSRKDYRKYNIKTVEGPDDYASMQEVVRRRYSRMKEEHLPLPDLIITDGGKGQMDVVKEVVVDELQLDIPIAGLAKDDRHRTNELLYGFPPQTVGLDIKSELFKVLTQIQDEVHRFAITFHRDKRSKHALHSELDDIKGLGPKGKEALLKRLKTVKGIKDADYQEIVSILGQAKGTLVYKHFHPDSTTTE